MPTTVQVPDPELAWKGEWDANTTYPPESVVGHEGSSWVTEIVSVGQVPTEGFPWSLVALRGAEGPPGPPGVAGDAESRIPVFIQSLPTEVWVIEHNLGYDPSVTVVDSAGTTVATEVRYVVSGALIEVHNRYPFSGKAILA